MVEQTEQSGEVFIFLVNEEKDEYSRYMLPGGAKDIEGDNVEYKTFFDKTKSYTVVVVKAEGLKKRILEKLIRLKESHFDAGKVKRYYRNSHDESVVNEIDDEIKEMHNAFQDFIDNIASLRNEPKNVTFFIHWGGGNDGSIKDNEETATRFLRLYNDRSTWSVYSLSSLRKTIFDVTASEIKVPDLAGLHRLKLRLAMVGDDMFERLQVACGILADDDCKDINEACNVLNEDQKAQIVDKIDKLLGNDGRECEIKAKLGNYIKDFPFTNHGKEYFDEFGLLLAKVMKGEW